VRQASIAASIDWALIHERLSKTSAGMQEPSPERVRMLLDERARSLAEVPETSRSSRDNLRLVCFTAGKEIYALEACYAREVIRCTDLMPVPGSPDFFLGVTILRGELLPAIHLAKFFELPQTQIMDPSRLLVVGRDRSDLALAVDDVIDISELSTEELREAPEQSRGRMRKYVRGITRDALIVLDGAALLNDTVAEEQNGGE
jgi:purine-binding chemotaxis protein CheW